MVTPRTSGTSWKGLTKLHFNPKDVLDVPQIGHRNPVDVLDVPIGCIVAPTDVLDVLLTHGFNPKDVQDVVIGLMLWGPLISGIYFIDYYIRYIC